MKTAAVLAAALVSLALPAAAQHAGGHSRTWSSHGYDFNGQQDRPGDFRCDAYWDRGRDDCDAAWRDQRPFVRHHGSGRGHPRGEGRYVYQPYSQGVQYYGAYGRPDQVYPGRGYGGYTGTPGGYRDDSRSAWCASRYRSYDPVSGYYRAYSGRLVFCG